MPRRTCPDCREEMGAIKILVSPRALSETVIYYAPLTEGRAFWTGAYQNAGVVSYWKCPRCGLIRAYGETEQDTLPLPADAPEPDSAALPLPADPPEPDPAALPRPVSGPDS